MAGPSEKYIPLPDAFCAGTAALPGVGGAANGLLAAFDMSGPVSVRRNPYKTVAPPAGEEVPWCRYGRYLDKRPVFTLDPLFHAGAYYVQEASSMFIEHIYRELFSENDRPRILDLCAAPGGKTTLLSSLAGADGLVVANETVRTRAAALADNVKKWGIGNVVVTSDDPARFGDYRGFFDLMLVDAPCSGEGMFRKMPEARNEWSPAVVDLCVGRSRRILADAWEALRPGGTLIFSTCTFNEQENEGTLRWLAREYNIERVEVVTDSAWGIVRGEVEGIPTFRFYPHIVRGEGFFAAVLRKGGRPTERIPKPKGNPFAELSGIDRAAAAAWFAYPDTMHFLRVGDNIHAYRRAALPAIRQLAGNLTVLYSGVRAGQLFNGKLRPDHALALFYDLSDSQAPVADLPREGALDYLRKNKNNPALFREGFNLVTCQNHPIGWIKRIGNRCNNMYPTPLRIATL